MTAQRKESSSPAEHDSEGGARKRVCKACDRCRLKKSKCDGASPCNRCQSDNAICVFGERKKSQDKVYPKGYVEVLEQQQEKLVSAIQEMYNRLERNEGWKGPPLGKTNKGVPLTHDILDRLGMLKLGPDEHDDHFEEDPDMLRKKLIKQEDDAYPTPRTAQSEFNTPINNDTEVFASHCFDNDLGRPLCQFQPTPPLLRTPEEQTPGLESSFNMGTEQTPCLESPFNLGAVQQTQQYWTQPPGAPVSYPEERSIWGTYDIPSIYSGIGVNSCLPTWGDDLGLTGFAQP